MSDSLPGASGAASQPNMRLIPRDEPRAFLEAPSVSRREFFGLVVRPAIVGTAFVAVLGRLNAPALAGVMTPCPGASNTCNSTTGANSCTTATPNTCAPNTCAGVTNECVGPGANACASSSGSPGNTCGDPSVGGQNTCSGTSPSNECAGNSAGGTGNSCGVTGKTSGSNACSDNISANVCSTSAGAAAGNNCIGPNQCQKDSIGVLSNTCQQGTGPAANTCAAGPPTTNTTQTYPGKLPV